MAALCSAVVLIGAVGVGIALFNGQGGEVTTGTVRATAVDALTMRDAPIQANDYRWGQVAVYPVIGDGTLYPIPAGLAGELWAAFMRMGTPGFVADRMVALRIAYTPSNETIAAVERVSVEPSQWMLTLNLAWELDRAGYLRVLIHEYAHLLTFDDGQVDADAQVCVTIVMQEGCLRVGADLHRFDARYWAPYGSQAPDPDSDSSKLAWSMYVRHSADFATPYAATNVAEDFAETFAEFVIRERPDPASGTWARKILFLWDEPAYVEIRERIRAWYADDLPTPQPPSDLQR